MPKPGSRQESQGEPQASSGRRQHLGRSGGAACGLSLPRHRTSPPRRPTPVDPAVHSPVPAVPAACGPPRADRLATPPATPRPRIGKICMPSTVLRSFAQSVSRPHLCVRPSWSPAPCPTPAPIPGAHVFPAPMRSTQPMPDRPGCRTRRSPTRCHQPPATAHQSATTQIADWADPVTVDREDGWATRCAQHGCSSRTVDWPRCDGDAKACRRRHHPLARLLHDRDAGSCGTAAGHGSRSVDLVQVRDLSDLVPSSARWNCAARPRPRSLLRRPPSTTPGAFVVPSADSRQGTRQFQLVATRPGWCFVRPVRPWSPAWSEPGRPWGVTPCRNPLTSKRRHR